ncbi:MAG: HD domain-containing protein [Firmicutes bacterium]|nr:HD domain-containing protein [Bacillota bacterium]
MTSLAPHLKRYFTLVALAGLTVFASSAAARPYVFLPVALAAAAVYVAAETVQLVLPSGAGFSSSIAPMMAFLWLFGPAPTLLALVLGAAATAVLRQANPHVALYNAGSWCIALWAASWFQPLSRPDPLFSMAGSYLTFYAIASGLLVGGLALYRRQPYGVVVRQYARETLVPFAGGFLVAVLMTAAAEAWGVAGIGVAVAVLTASQAALQAYGRTLRGRIVHRLIARWNAGAHAADPRVRRALHYATAIAEELGLDSAEQATLREAVLLCDIAVESLLPGLRARSGPLAPEERALLERHPAAGAEAVGQFAELADVARAVRHHHERWDGGGYPDGLAGEAIPVPARILAVVDAYLALTQPYPYRGTPLGPEEALGVLLEESGRQFWPPAVEALRRILAREAAQNLLAATAEREQVVKAALDHLVASIRRQRAVRQRFAGGAPVTPEHWRALYELGRLVAGSRSVTEVADVTLGVMARLFTGGGLVAVADVEGWTVRSVRRLPAGLIGRRLDLEAADLAAAGQEGAVRLCDARRAGAWAAPFAAEGLHQILVLPARWNERTVALIVVGRSWGFGEAEREVAEIVAAQAALAFGNARLFQELEARLAEIEALRDAERLAAVGRMAAAAAHEIRNPLTAVKGFLELLKRDPRGEDLPRILPLVLSELGRIERLTSDMLLLARPPADPRAACDLAEEVAAVLQLLGGEIEAGGVELRRAGLDGPARVRGEGPRVRQVVLNLVRNALEAMPGGGRLALELEEAGGEYVLSVSDSGPGLPAEILDRLFEPFQTTKPSGTGLGLAVCASIVQSLGGRIEAANRPEGGARFRVVWPKAGGEGGPRAAAAPGTV